VEVSRCAHPQEILAAIFKLLRYGATRLKPLEGGGREGTGSGAQHALVLVRWFAGGEVCRARYCNCSSRKGRGERDEPGRKALLLLLCEVWW
jgi:hypothetical protein